MKQKSSFKNAVVKPKITAFMPLIEVKTALSILNSNDTVELKKQNHDYCKTNTSKNNSLTHMTNLHYCSLIKHAIFKQQWLHVVKLLLAYIDEPRSDKHTMGVIFKYTLICLLNDPVAQTYGVLDEFLQLALSFQTAEARSKFLKLLMTLPKAGITQHNLEDNKLNVKINEENSEDE